MRSTWLIASLLLASGVSSEQTPAALRVTVTLTDAAQTPMPIAGHALLISDNPPTRAPRRVLTSANGTVVVSLVPGSYIVESDRPVAFAGKAYQWTAIVDVVPGQGATLALTLENAEVLASTEAMPGTGGTASNPVVAAEIEKRHSSLVTIWSPTSKATGFVVDARGLVATDRNGVGSASSVEMQLSPSVKVPARVLVADVAQDVAILWVDPSVLSQAPPISLACAPAATPPANDGDEVVAMTASLQGRSELLRGEITGFHPRGIETDLPLSFGDSGGPVFTADQSRVLGLTSVGPESDASRHSDALVVRAAVVCEALSTARSKMSGTTPPAATALPTEPARSSAAGSKATSTPAAKGVATPPVVSSADFDVALITPPAILRAREQADRTGGPSARLPEAEALLGRLTDFGSWADYFVDVPPVLIIRVAPKLVEGFWKRLAREAARTQGAELPPFKDFKSSFVRLRATCGDTEVAPIHPFVLEHAVADKRVVREGLYVFSADAFGPHCRAVTLTLWSELRPEKGDSLTIDAKAIDQIWQDLAPYRATSR